MIKVAVRVIFRKVALARTWAEGRVLDQPLDPITEVLRSIDDKQRPCIAVYTSELKGKPVGLESQSGVQSIKMMIYIYLPPAKVTTPETVTFEIDNVGSGLALDTIERQVEAAMRYGNEAWIKLWRRFVLSIDEKLSRYVLVEIERGVKIPCLEVQYDLNCVAEADFGKPLYGAWAELDAELRAEGGEGIVLADHIKAMIESPADLEDFEQFQLNHGLTDAAFTASGHKPLVTLDDGSAPDLASVDAPPEIEIVGPQQVP